MLFQAKGAGQSDSVRLESFTLSECLQGTCNLDYRHHVADYRFTDNILNLQLDGFANCSGVHDVTVRVSHDTLFLSFKDGGLELAPVYSIEYDSITKQGDTVTIPSEVVMHTYVVADFTSCDCPFLFDFRIAGLSENVKYKLWVNDQFVFFRTNNEMKKDSLRLNEVVQQIWNVPKVVEVKALFEKTTENRELDLLILPYNDELNSYELKLVEHNSIGLTTYYQFKVFPDSDYLIKYFDKPNNRLIDLEEWQNQEESTR